MNLNLNLNLNVDDSIRDFIEKYVAPEKRGQALNELTKIKKATIKSVVIKVNDFNQSLNTDLERTLNA